MNKKLTAVLSVIVILVFIGYIIFDSISSGSSDEDIVEINNSESIPDSWIISGELQVDDGSLRAVTVPSTGSIYIGGDSFVQCYDKDLNLIWNLKTPYSVTALSNFGDSIFASTMDMILVISSDGQLINEWGPYEDNSIITSVASNRSYVVFADAGTKAVFCLDKGGEVKSLIGHSGEPFIIPSPYFDVAIDSDNTLFIANTGHRRVETRTIDGELISYFGEAGTAPDAFCGCCNPAHFILFPEGFATAEKGINRIKILDENGAFVEYVSSENNFTPSVPLDLASADGKTIYAANPADSKLYIFTRK
ncbi:MAG TPA: hypothetical protein VMV77_11810 [Bacteroidales bacterium]|nr:hypothetical protein [Bacteroidales bacterium]